MVGFQCFIFTQFFALFTNHLVDLNVRNKTDLQTDIDIYFTFDNVFNVVILSPVLETFFLVCTYLIFILYVNKLNAILLTSILSSLLHYSDSILNCIVIFPIFFVMTLLLVCRNQIPIYQRVLSIMVIHLINNLLAMNLLYIFK